MPVQKWGYLISFANDTCKYLRARRLCMVEGQKMTTINITQVRRGWKTDCRNASICRKSHKTGPSKLLQGIRCARSTQEFPEIKVKAERRDNLGSSLVVQWLGLGAFTVVVRVRSLVKELDPTYVYVCMYVCVCVCMYVCVTCHNLGAHVNQCQLISACLTSAHDTFFALFLHY